MNKFHKKNMKNKNRFIYNVMEIIFEKLKK